MRRDTLNRKCGIATRLVIFLTLSLVGGLCPVGALGGQTGTESVREVTFAGHNLKLAGTMLVPARKNSATRLPAAVIVGEMGTTTRDGLQVGSAAHLVYRDLATALARQGLVTLRYDRRCRGASECKKIEAYDDYIDDLHGAIKFLSAQPEVDPKRIVLIGHGEGGFIATSLLAQFENAAAGLVVVSMSGRTLGKMLRDEIQARMSEEGRPTAEIRENQAKAERITRALFYSRPEVIKETFDPANPYDMELREVINESPRAVSLLVNDPLQAFAALRLPILILQGGKDLEVTTKDAFFLEEALKRIYHPDHTLRTLAEMDHLLKVNKGQPTFASYKDETRPIDPELTTMIAEWVLERYGDAAGVGKKRQVQK
ncbi:MAG: alpha/beta hydrolase [Acidobacteriota bacterium]